MTDAELKKIYKSKLEKKLKKDKIQAGFKTTTSEKFLEWFDLETFKKGCHYCGTTNEVSLNLFLKQRNGIRLDATRGGKRSKRLELDRKDPSLPYDKLDNLVWCCYWCNNAKSNFFSESEFKPIAKVIGEVIKNIELFVCV